MLQKSTRPANPGDNRKWFLVDAKDQVLGRLAVVVANKLRAKDTPAFDRNNLLRSHFSKSP